MPPLQERQNKLRSFIQLANESLTRSEFKDAFQRATRLIQVAITDLNTKIDRRLAQIKDGTQGPRGLKGDKGDSVAGPQGIKGAKGDKGDKGDPGTPGKDADVRDAVRLTIPQVLKELDRRVPLLGDALKSGLETHLNTLLSGIDFGPGSGTSFAIMQSGVQKVQQPLALDFKGTGAPTVTVDSHGVTRLDFPGSSGTPINNEVVSGSGTAYTLAHTPTSGSVRLYARGQRIFPTTNYTLSGATITTVDTWAANDIVADYTY